MSEAGQVVTPPAPTPPPAVVEPLAPTPTPTPAPAFNGKAAPAPTPEPAATEPTPTASWPDDWRERLAGDDAKRLAHLKRFASPENYLNRTVGIENQLRSGLLKPVLADGAAEAEVAEYRKAHGIPAEPSLEGYGVELPKDVDETIKGDLGKFVARMHKINSPAPVVKEAIGVFFELEAEAEQQFYEVAQKATVDHKAEIRAEYGRDYDRNLALGNTFIAKHLGEKAPELTAIPLADGTLLGDHPDFVRLFVAAALAGADDVSLATAESAPGAGTIKEQYEAGLKLMDTDPKKYHSPEHQAKMVKLANAMTSQKAA